MSDKLTIKQEKFCIEYLKDGNASRAYREAYEVTTTNENTINVQANKILNNPKVALRLDELRTKLEDSNILTAKQLKEFFTKVVMNTLEDDEPKLNDRLKAAELLGKTMAMFTDKQEVKHSGEITKIERVITDTPNTNA